MTTKKCPSLPPNPRSDNRPVVTLLTDFGTRDWFAAVLKGVILGMEPGATVVDITHEIPPFAVREGAFVLQAAWKHFPPGTVHVAVVDPGVGTPRRALLVACGGHYFLGPDNGLLTPVLGRGCRVWSLTCRRPGEGGRTFDGRDVFAPAAARLLGGTTPNALGRRVAAGKTLVRLAGFSARLRGTKLTGTVQYTDRFGNRITNLGENALRTIAGRGGDLRRLAVTCQGRRLPFCASYAAVPPGGCGWLLNSLGLLEICANQAPAPLAGGRAEVTAVRSSGSRL